MATKSLLNKAKTISKNEIKTTSQILHHRILFHFSLALFNKQKMELRWGRLLHLFWLKYIYQIFKQKYFY